MPDSPKIAAIVTCFYPRSHADVILMKFLKGFPTDEGLQKPRVTLASMYLDQRHGRDVGVGVAQANGIPLFGSIKEALTLGGKDLAVDGVLLIGEHGVYPENELEQTMYPRKCFFEQIAAVFGKSGRAVPVFNDKGLAYNRADSVWMYRRAQELDIAFMAGSSLPVSHRQPFLELPLDCPLEEALVIGWAGMEIYGFHTLEVLQCMVERRAGGESGVRAIEVVEGPDVWEAGRAGRWNREFFEIGLGCIESREAGRPEEKCPRPAFFDIEYRDGFHAQVLMLNTYVRDFAFVGRAGGDIVACDFYTQHGYPHAHFNYLGLNIEEMFVTGRPQYPVERTLFTSCMLDAVLHARAHPPRRIELPELDLRYRSYETLRWRPTRPRPAGANLDVWPHQW
ncbi:MAG: hypothetical protein HYU36_05925 [Planctomycetes bacterium]|nr:hypothetical protein [Planctomycetota bacterium]